MLRVCGRFDEAQEVLDTALPAHPHDLVLHMEQVYVLSARDEDEAAAAAMGRTLALSPKSPWLLENRIDYLRFAEQLAEAERTAEEALRLYPRNAGLHMARALVLNAQGRNTEALSAAETAVDRRPDNPSFLQHRTNLLYLNSRFAEAAEV